MIYKTEQEHTASIERGRGKTNMTFKAKGENSSSNVPYLNKKIDIPTDKVWKSLDINNESLHVKMLFHFLDH